ncbi:asparaginase domain-containing protein [Denitrificimonas sp. JX-1]|uniref:Asparaginase domain-containing protein n=1 Tax=Denitrificimonas halotolerans TaxID=3098930 RepID=A0ABU5GNS6_9GAMM|nr:asparaginase domain-containing protein [Denitrificimonas sp. JX-1]MDY7218658.1 asparaginase domain-containing protein [Denitrificimonas sp. JX-1]
MHIHILTTGGTFDKIYHDALSEFTIGEPMAPELLDEAGVNLTYTVESLLKKDSLEFTESDRELLRQRVLSSPHTHILIIHGTDTMTLSAQFLGQVNRKTVVFTGAMQPARMRKSDAPFNLGFAIGILQCLDSGIYIAMNGQVFNTDNVQKNRQMGRFETL